MNSSINIALVDDHILLRNGLSSLLREFNYNVSLECSNGNEFITAVTTRNPKIDILLLDINMPVMDGYELASWSKINIPEVKIIALSMYDDEKAIIRMITNGARGYLLKDCEPVELNRAIQDVFLKGYYYSDLISSRLVHNINSDKNSGEDYQKSLRLHPREIQFLKLLATEFTYKEIADHMNLSPRTIDGYRDALFEKLGAKNRIGLVLFAIRNGIVML